MLSPHSPEPWLPWLKLNSRAPRYDVKRQNVKLMYTEFRRDFILH